MLVIEKKIRSEREALEFVRHCEEDFDRRLSAAICGVLEDKSVRCITLSGPTCAGKTTAAHKLVDELKARGRTAKIVSIDDFFHASGEIDVIDRVVDYDSVAAIDLDYLSVCVSDLMEGRRAKLPFFDFQVRKRTKTHEYSLGENDVVIFEGIQAVYPEVTALLKPYGYKAVFVNVTEDVSVNGVCFTKNDVRLARRIVRDYRFRAASPEFTLHIWDSVRRNEDTSIFPNIGADAYLLDSFQPFEPFMIGQFIMPLLDTVRNESPYYENARNLYDRFYAIRGNEISPDCLSEDSLYHEFLG